MSDREDGAPQDVPAGEGLVTLAVQLRPEHVRRLRSMAAREGATAEAFAALLLEERLDAEAGTSVSE